MGLQASRLMATAEHVVKALNRARIAERQNRVRRIYQQKLAFRDLPKVTDAEARRLIDEHIQRHGVKRLEPGYAASVEPSQKL